MGSNLATYLPMKLVFIVPYTFLVNLRSCILQPLCRHVEALCRVMSTFIVFFEE